MLPPSITPSLNQRQQKISSGEAGHRCRDLLGVTVCASADPAFCRRFQSSTAGASVVSIKPLNVVSDVCDTADAHKAGRVVVDLDYAGRSREGLEIAERLQGRNIAVVVLIRSGKKLSPETLNALDAAGAEVWWDSRALLTHKIEQYIERHRSEGVKTMADVGRRIGIDGGTLSAHCNRAFGMQSLTNAAFEQLGITEELRARCHNLKVLGLSVEQRRSLRPEADCAIDLLLEGTKGKYPGDLAAVKLIYEGLPKPKPYSREEIYSVVREAREARGIEDPTTALVREMHAVDRALRAFRDPDLERKMRDQQVGRLLEELALVELQLSRSRQVTQLSATVVRDSAGEITRTADILDAVVITPHNQLTLGKALCEMAVRRGRLEKLDEGTLLVEPPEKEGQPQRLMYRANNGALIPLIELKLPELTAEVMNGSLAARYRDPATGEVLFPMLPRVMNQLDRSIVEFMDMMHDAPQPSEEHCWQRGLPFRACEYKKAGAQSPSAIAEIKRQLAGQRDAILRAQREAPDSVLGMTSGVDVVVLRDNHGIRAAVDELNAEQPFFNYRVFSPTMTKQLVTPLQRGRLELHEVEALTDFFARLNAHLAQFPTLPVPEGIFEDGLNAVRATSQFELQGKTGISLEKLGRNPGCFLAWNLEMVRLVAERLEPAVATDPLERESEQRRLLVKGMRAIQHAVSDTMMVASEASDVADLPGPAKAACERYVAARTGVNAAIEALDRYLIGAAAVEPEQLTRILHQHIGEGGMPANYNSSLAARIEEGGQFKTLRRVFGGESAQIGALFQDAERLLQSHPQAAEAAHARIEDPDSLQRFLKLLQLELAEKQEFAARNTALERQFSLKLLEFKLGRPTVQSEQRFGERMTHLAPVSCGVLDQLRCKLSGESPDHERGAQEATLASLLICGGPELRQRVIGFSAHAVDAALRDVVSRYHGALGADHGAMHGPQLDQRLPSVSSVRHLRTEADDVRLGEHRPIQEQMITFAAQLRTLSEQILDVASHAEGPPRGAYSEWRRSLADIGAAHKEVVDFSLERVMNESTEFRPLRRTVGAVSCVAKVADRLAGSALFAGLARELQGVEDEGQATAIVEQFAAKLSDPKKVEALRRASQEAVIDFAPRFSESQKMELCASLLTRIGAVEERALFEFHDRTLSRAVLLEAIHPAVAADYLRSSLEGFLRYPGSYGDHYIDRFGAVHAELRQQFARNPTFATQVDSYLQAAAKGHESTTEEERGRLLVATVRSELRNHRFFAPPGDAIKPQTAELLAAIAAGDFGTAARLVDRECSEDTMLHLMRILATENRNPHLRLHRRGELLTKDVELQMYNSGSSLSGSYGRAMDELLRTSREGLKTAAEGYELMRRSGIFLFERELPKKESVLSEVRKAAFDFMTISAAHLQQLDISPLEALNAKLYRGFRYYERMTQARQTLDSLVPNWRLVYLQATDYLADFCGYKPKVVNGAARE